jgi:hypothetical protein
MNSETAQQEAKDWLEIFLGTDVRDVTPTVSTIWANIETVGDGEIEEQAFYQMIPRVCQILIAGTSLDEFPQIVREEAHHVLSHCYRQIEASLLEKYKDELDDEEVAEAYDEFIGAVTEEFKKLIAPLEVTHE